MKQEKLIWELICIHSISLILVFETENSKEKEVPKKKKMDNDFYNDNDFYGDGNAGKVFIF